MGFNTQERLKRAEAVMQNKSLLVKEYPRQDCTYIYMLSKQRRALNTDVTTKLWPHNYLYNVEWKLVQGFHSNYNIFFQKLQYSYENETVQL